MWSAFIGAAHLRDLRRRAAGQGRAVCRGWSRPVVRLARSGMVEVQRFARGHLARDQRGGGRVMTTSARQIKTHAVDKMAWAWC